MVSLLSYPELSRQCQFCLLSTSITMSIFDPVEQDCLHKASRNSYKKYYPPAKSSEQQAIIPNPAIFNSLADFQTDQIGGIATSSENEDSSLRITPSGASCAVHLELLEAFMVLRMLVIKSGWLDKSFGLMPAKRDDALLAKRRQLKWILAVILAVARFEAWWSNVDFLLKTNANVKNSVTQLTLDTLPPVGEQDTVLKRFHSINTLMTTRRPHGMAWIHAQSQALS